MDHHETVEIAGVRMSAAAARWLESTGINADDVRSDLHRLRTHQTTREQLTELCSDGAHREDAQAVADYVSAVCLAAGVTS